MLGTVGPMKRDEVISGWYDVTGKRGSKTGKLHLSFLLSTQLETKDLDTKYCNTFSYKSVLDQMKAGNLIAFNAPGIIATSLQLVSNSPFSHVGLIVEMPNKYTDEEELYLLEVGRNHGAFIFFVRVLF